MAEIEAREASGEDLWNSESIPPPARMKIAHAWEVLLGDDPVRRNRFWAKIESVFRRNGLENWARSSAHVQGITDLDLMLNHIEAGWGVMAEMSGRHQELFARAVNETFNDHRIAFRLVEGEIIPFSSDELHVEVVVPTLRLLTDSRFESAHNAYLKALKEISNNDPGDAITDAGTALQEALVALGCEGKSLGPLWTDAKKKGVFTGHDQNLLTGVSKFVDWASADRSTTGDAHSHGDAAIADAWLMVHIVGALILRLADPAKREDTE